MRSRISRVAEDFFKLREEHRLKLKEALNGLKISNVDIDKLYVKKLKNTSVMDLLGLRK